MLTTERLSKMCACDAHKKAPLLRGSVAFYFPDGSNLPVTGVQRIEQQDVELYAIPESHVALYFRDNAVNE